LPYTVRKPPPEHKINPEESRRAPQSNDPGLASARGHVKSAYVLRASDQTDLLKKHETKTPQPECTLFFKIRRRIEARLMG